MAKMQCVNCGESVDEAKAFCPACGHAFVSEDARRDESSFESMDSTVQFGQTMYNQMLSDMGLDAKIAPEKRIEVIAPAVRDVQPAADAKPARPKPVEPGLSRNAKWAIWGGAVLVMILLLGLVVAAVLLMYLQR